jgi:hypothetical protein
VTFWDALSVIALASASMPSVFFASKMWARQPQAARLSAFLAAAFLVHGSYHLLVVMGAPQTAILTIESASAVLILVFAGLYWREREAPG